MTQGIKVGLISCSGEEISEGTLSRVAVRLVLEKLKDRTVTICLPLFLAGDGGERSFARKFPTIAVDGCGKLCAKKGTEKYSGAVDDVLVIDELLTAWGEERPKSRRTLTPEDMKLAERIADELARRVDAVLARAQDEGRGEAVEDVPSGGSCACMSGGPKANTLEVAGMKIEVQALDRIITLVSKRKNLDESQISRELSKQVRIYNSIPDEISEEALCSVLIAEYRRQVS